MLDIPTAGGRRAWQAHAHACGNGVKDLGHLGRTCTPRALGGGEPGVGTATTGAQYSLSLPRSVQSKRLTHAHTTHNNDNDSNRTHPHGTPTAPGKMTRELRVFQRHWGERYRPRAQGRETRVCLGDVVGRWGKTNCQLQPKQKRGMGVSGNPDAAYWCWRAGRAARSNTRRFMHRHIGRKKIGTSNSCFSLRT